MLVDGWLGRGRAIVIECPLGCPSSGRNVKKCDLWSPSRGINVIMCPVDKMQWRALYGAPSTGKKCDKVSLDAPPVDKV